MGIYIEGHKILTTNLNIEILKAVGAKNTEHAFLRILIMGFNDELLRFPLISCSLRHTFTRLKGRNDFSLYFHFISVYEFSRYMFQQLNLSKRLWKNELKGH